MDARSFKVGDVVTREGDDRHRVIDAGDGYGEMTVKCILAPRSGFCEVGDEEMNLQDRYRLISGAD